ncbi:MAG: hypothetical protein D6818_02535 [Bacteroidetes bacterium]|nr:MAG: hypothetical protein D6818_02535 [Bacteroidota bacterium]
MQYKGLWVVAIALMTTGCVSKKKWEAEVLHREQCETQRQQVEAAYADALDEIEKLRLDLREEQGAVRALEGVVRDRNQRVEALLQQIERMKDELAAQRKMMDLTLQRQLEAIAEKEAAIDALRQEIAARNARLQQVASELRDTLQAAGVAAEAILVAGEAVVRLPAEAVFPERDVTPTREGLQVIQQLGEVLLQYPRFLVRVEVHHDNQPVRSRRWTDSWSFTHERALHLARLLADEAGIPPNKLIPAGRGEYLPLASNDTEEGRARNRRIELHLYLEQDDVVARIKALGEGERE